MRKNGGGGVCCVLLTVTCCLFMLWFDSTMLFWMILLYNLLDTIVQAPNFEILTCCWAPMLWADWFLLESLPSESWLNASCLGYLVLNLKQNSMARRHALFLGRHALSDSAMPFFLAPCHQNVPLIKIFTWSDDFWHCAISINIVLLGDCTNWHLAKTS